ncbi:MAG: flagellar hook-length control protein FliK [Candidatus Anammoxibacter sp.]
MQDTNVLLTQSKTTLFNEAIKVKPQGNILKGANVQKGQAFVDLLFSSGRVEADNAVDIKFNDQIKHDPPALAETKKSDSFSKQNNYAVNDSSSDYDDYNQESYQDIYNEDSDRFASQNRASDMSVLEDDKADTKSSDNLVAVADPYNELEVETAQEIGGFNSYKEVSDKESLADGNEAEIEDNEIKSEIITKLEGKLSNFEGKNAEEIKTEIVSKLKEVLAGLEEGGVKGDKSEIITKLEGKLSNFEGKNVEEIKTEIVSKLKEVLAGLEEGGVKGDKSEIITKLEGIISSLEGKGGKSEIITKLNVVIAGLGEPGGKAVRAGIVDEQSNSGKNKKVVKKGEGEITTDTLKSIVENFEENKNDKTVGKDKNIEKKPRTNDVASNNTNGGKVSAKTKESTDGSTKSTGDSIAALDDETGAEIRVTKEGNRVETLNSGRDIKVDQRVVVGTQGAKGGQADQHRNKNMPASQAQNVKSDKGNSQRTDADQQVVINKTQTTFRSAVAGQVKNTPAPARTIPQSQLAETIVHNAKQFQKGGNSEIHLTIKKPELGNVKLSFVENGKGKLEVTLVAERHETAELIKQNSSEMRQLLQDDGVDLSKFEVFDQDEMNKRHLAQGGSSNNGSRKNSSDAAEDDGFDNAEATPAENNDLNVSDVENIDNRDDQVNVFA